MQRTDESEGPQRLPRRRRPWRWIGWGVVVFVAVIVVTEILISGAAPSVQGLIIDTLSKRFNSKVELDKVQLSLAQGLNVSADGLRIYPPNALIAAGVQEPLISIAHFEFHAGLLRLIERPVHVGTVQVRGLAINIPPREMRQQEPEHKPAVGKFKIMIDRILCDDSRLVIGTAKPDKDPKVFLLKHIVLHDVDPYAPWPFDATLTNAIPRGEIHATGSFGPWDTDMPGDSSVSGKYSFDHADMNTIKGIGGLLHSTGEFDGQLNRIAVRGTTEVPDFSLDTGGHPMRLWTRFNAVVDGTSGDTYLDQVQARLAESDFVCKGAVINIKGKGHIIQIDVDVPAGRIQDFLRLSVRTEPPSMTGVIGMKARIHIRAGTDRVTQKMTMNGKFAIHQIHFTDPEVEDKVDMLSLRAKGDPQQAKPGAPDIQSEMTGQFDMGEEKLHFQELNYTVPGASVQLVGDYALSGQEFAFTGRLHTQAKLSQMVASKWKSILLKPIDPFFQKHGDGADIPIKISGTKTSPHFGLKLGGGK